MVRAILDDDGMGVGQSIRNPRVLLDGDCVDATPVPTDPASILDAYPVFTVKKRAVTVNEETGNPVFSWTDIATGAGVEWVERTEYEPESGATVVKARATMLYEGDEVVKETAVLVSSLGGTYKITGIDQSATSLSFELERIESDGW